MRRAADDKRASQRDQHDAHYFPKTHAVLLWHRGTQCRHYNSPQHPLWAYHQTMRGRQPFRRFGRFHTLALVLYALFLATAQFEHHDLACELKTPHPLHVVYVESARF